MKSPIAPLADCGRSRAVDYRRAIDVGDDATLLDSVQERRKPWFGAPGDRPSNERSALEGEHSSGSGGLVAAPELLQRGECVL